MTDPELQATMHALEALLVPAYYTDLHLFCLHLCLGVKISLQHGTSGASAIACGWLGTILGPGFRPSSDGYPPPKLPSHPVRNAAFIPRPPQPPHLLALLPPLP